jgi:hypothetical protein
MKLVAKIELSTSAGFIDLTNIPQDADDLYLVTSLRSTNGGAQASPQVRFNNSSGNVYGRTGLVMRGTNLSSTSSTPTSVLILTEGANAADATAGNFGAASIFIPEYRRNAHKTVRANWGSLTSFGASPVATIGFASVNYSGDTNPISTISITEGQSQSFAAGSTVWLYTITKA